MLALLFPICVYMLRSRVPRFGMLALAMFLLGSAIIEHEHLALRHFTSYASLTTFMVLMIGAIMLADLLSRNR